MFARFTLTALAVGCFCVSQAYAADVGGTPARHQAMPAPAIESPYEQTPAEPQRSATRPLRSDLAVDRQQVGETLDSAIAHEKSRRAWAITGLVVGGVAIVGGLVYAAVDAQRRANATGKDQYSVNWIGIGVGAPLVAVSIYNLVGAQKQLRRLGVRQARIGLAPSIDGTQLQVALDF